MRGIQKESSWVGLDGRKYHWHLKYHSQSEANLLTLLLFQKELLGFCHSKELLKKKLKLFVLQLFQVLNPCLKRKVKDSFRNDPRDKSVKHEDKEALFEEYILN